MQQTEYDQEKRYWNRCYLLVLLWLIVLIILFTWFTNSWK